MTKVMNMQFISVDDEFDTDGTDDDYDDDYEGCGNEGYCNICNPNLDDDEDD